MKRLNFRIRFLTDIILNVSAATEGNNATLEYIPGSALLGIAAQDYKSFGNNSFVILHSGKVRFSDGHLLGNSRSFKVPASYFVKKGESLENNDRLYIHHQITPNQKEEFRKDGTQFKQQRSGYLVNQADSLKKLDLAKDFSIKSAYDRKSRKAQDTKMFGYEFLKSGSEWAFYIEMEEENPTIEEQIKNAVTGTKRLGRSRTAEFGLIEVSFINSESPLSKTENLAGTKVILYAESLLAFVNEYGLPTLTPQAKDFGIEGEILWAECQVLTRSFAPYNAKRATRESDRICIDKGSVFLVQVNGAIDHAKLTRGVGLFINEGYGKVMVNPEFLTSKSIKIEASVMGKTHWKSNQSLTPIPVPLNEIPLLKYLENKAKKEYAEFDILRKVDDFIKVNNNAYRKIKPSQWGGIRERASRTDCSLMELLFGEADGKVNHEKGYLTHGVAAIDWTERGRLPKLKSWIESFAEKDRRQATSVLAAAMAKKSNQK